MMNSDEVSFPFLIGGKTKADIPEMTPKEAWRSLSHKFHGKTSGRMKTEKRLKKIAEERNQLKMNSGDTPTGMTSAFARRQEKTGEAHMVLSVGNKGSVQQGQSKPRIRR